MPAVLPEETFSQHQGAGQGGLTVAARLKQLGVRALVSNLLRILILERDMLTRVLLRSLTEMIALVIIGEIDTISWCSTTPSGKFILIAFVTYQDDDNVHCGESPLAHSQYLPSSD